MNARTFYERDEWRRLRYQVLRKCGFKCLSCGRSRTGGAELHVDHIKPISIYPELALLEANLQVLCKECNLGKSNLYLDDLRPKPISAMQARKIKKSRVGEEKFRPMRRVFACVRIADYIKNKMAAAEQRKDPVAQSKYLQEYLRMQRKITSMVMHTREMDA